jgi:hypothetical protein
MLHSARRLGNNRELIIAGHLTYNLDETAINDWTFITRRIDSYVNGQRQPDSDGRDASMIRDANADAVIAMLQEGTYNRWDDDSGAWNIEIETPESPQEGT